MNRFLTIILLLFLLVSCSSVGTPPIRYYVINPVEQQPLAPDMATSSLNIRIVDVSIPQYLEHFQIARRSGEQELTFSDDHQWGENLRKNLIRTMARNLSRQLDSPTVFTPLVRSSSKPKYTINISIDQFEQDSQGVIQLSARYQISEARDKGVLTTRVFEQRMTSDHRTGFPQMVSTMQSLYNLLCLDISKTLIGLEGL